MTGKPASFGKAQRAVIFVQHPELTKKGKDLLRFLVTFWPNIWPGWPAIMAFTGATTQRACQKQIAELIRIGLVECTNAGHVGRGMASKYRICFENNAYPDRTPSGEVLVEKGEQKPDESSPFPTQKDEQNGPDRAERVNDSDQKGEQFSEKYEQNPHLLFTTSLSQAKHKPTLQANRKLREPKIGWTAGSFFLQD